MAGSRCCRFRFSGATPAQQNHGAAERRRRVTRAEGNTPRRDAAVAAGGGRDETRDATSRRGAAAETAARQPSLRPNTFPSDPHAARGLYGRRRINRPLGPTQKEAHANVVLEAEWFLRTLLGPTQTYAQKKKKKLTISRTLLGSAHSYAPVPSLRVDESILHQTAESCVPWVRPIRMRKKNKHDPQY